MHPQPKNRHFLHSSIDCLVKRQFHITSIDGKPLVACDKAMRSINLLFIIYQIEMMLANTEIARDKNVDIYHMRLYIIISLGLQSNRCKSKTSKELLYHFAIFRTMNFKYNCFSMLIYVPELINDYLRLIGLLKSYV